MERVGHVIGKVRAASPVVSSDLFVHIFHRVILFHLESGHVWVKSDWLSLKANSHSSH